MMATVMIEYYGVHGEGRTVTEAKRDAGARLSRFVNDYRPFVLQCGDDTIVGYPTPESWGYWFARDGNLSGGCCSYADRQSCERAARKHLASIGLSIDSDPNEIPTILANADDRQAWPTEARKWQRFQRAYRDARDRGMTDHEAHEYACRAA